MSLRPVNDSQYSIWHKSIAFRHHMAKFTALWLNSYTITKHKSIIIHPSMLSVENADELRSE
jgi:hypothetical protein